MPLRAQDGLLCLIGQQRRREQKRDSRTYADRLSEIGKIQVHLVLHLLVLCRHDLHLAVKRRSVLRNPRIWPR